MRFLFTALIMFFLTVPVHSRDIGQWENTDPQIREWYKTLMRPDAPAMSCCGEADAYWADSFGMTPDGNYIAIITDTRPDVPLGRPHRPFGLRIVIPKEKMKIDAGNPTGHGVVFLAYQNQKDIDAGEPPNVFCYVTGTLG